MSGSLDTGGAIGAGGQSVRESGSFWDVQTTGQELSANGAGKTTDQLQAPIDYTGIYAGWNVDLDNADGDDDPATGADDFWDFGASDEYPVLKFDFDGDGSATWQEFGNQRGMAISAADVCLEALPDARVVTGSWSSACLSANRPGSFARFYYFTLDADSDVFIDLQSDDVNTYLYLQEGAGTQSDSFRSQGSADRYSRIEDWLDAGTYTIEAATFDAGQVGSFTLTVTLHGGFATAPEPTGAPADVPPPPDLPPPPMLAPTSAPVPTPLPTRTSRPTPTPAPTATPTKAPAPIPARNPGDSGSGGFCNFTGANVPMGAGAISLFLLAAPLAVIQGLKLRRGNGSRSSRSPNPHRVTE